MTAIMQNANMLIYSFAAATLVLETFLFTLAWQYLLIPLSIKVTLRKTFAYVWIGAFADILVPAESVTGEVAKAYLMSKEPNINSGKVIASLIGQRMLGTIITTVTLFTCFLGLLAFNYSVSDLMLQLLVLTTVSTAAAFVFLVAVCVKEKWTERLVNTVMRFVERISRGRFKLEHFETKIIDALRGFYSSLRTFGSKPTTLISPTLFQILSWLSSIAIVLLVFAAIGYTETNTSIFVLKIIVVYTLLVAVKSIPIGVPAEVGLPDILMTTLFFLFGIPLDVSGAATILTRILTLWLRFFIGFGAVQWLGVKILMESGLFGKPKDKV